MEPPNLFVDHLARCGLISPTQTQQVMLWVAGRCDPVGLIAVEHGLLVGEQVEAILERQNGCDWRFGEVAVAAGYLTKPDLDRILEVQKHRRWSSVAEAVILAGILPSERVYRAFAEFVLDHSSGDASAYSAAA